MEEEKVFMNRMNTVLEMLSLRTCKTFKWRCQREKGLKKISYKWQAWIQLYERYIVHSLFPWRILISYYSTFSREQLIKVYLVMIMKITMKCKERKRRGKIQKTKMKRRKRNWGLNRDWLGIYEYRKLGQGRLEGLGSMRGFHLKFLAHHKDKV